MLGMIMTVVVVMKEVEVIMSKGQEGFSESKCIARSQDGCST